MTKKGDDQGKDAHAQFQQGYRLLFGRTAAADRPQAVECLERAAVQGHVGAQGLLGIALYPVIDPSRPPLTGTTYDDDRRAAETWFKKALPGLKRLAKEGQPICAWILGFIYEKGCGVRQNLATAQRFYQAAGHAGLSVAAERASFLAMKELKWSDALYWSLISEQLGARSPSSNRSQIEKFLSKEELQGVRKRFESWIPPKP